jgi:ATP-dependent DNA helicase 2 subunit 1
VLQAPGMNLIFLPYADDIRKLRFEPTPIATDQLIQDAKKVVAKLTVKSLPHISNPVLQRHYRVIQAIALEEEPPAEDEDLLMPDAEGMAKYAPLIQQLATDTRTLGEAAQEEAEPVSRKRKTAASGDEDGPKRPKKEEPDYVDIDWQQHLANGEHDNKARWVDELHR